ncbi:MAG: Acyl-CoA dehydrogenase [Rhodocyclaceae bacterium]|nr:Acyl-CoA dehydrogenase [Rhodocyclaceae bacterium]
MNFEPTAEQSAAREMARTFASREIKPYWRAREAEARFHRDLIEKMAAAGMFGCLFPEDFGGNGLGFVAQVLIMEEMMRASIESGMPFNQQGVNVPMAIYRWGTDEQKRRYVPGLVSARYIGAFGLTEPGGGSDSAGMKTRAVRHGDRYVVNGAKLWITYGSVADVILLFAKTDPARGHDGISAFLVETRDLKGFSSKAIAADIGTQCVPTAELFFHDVEIPADSLLGGVEGQGFKAAMSTLHYGRVCVPARAIGIAQASLDLAIDYAKERTAFGKRIGEFQAIQHTIADMLAKTEAMRWLVYRAAARADQGLPFGREASIAKYYAGEAVIDITEKCLEIFGGFGFARELPVFRYFTCARLMRTGEGSANIQKNLLGMDALGWKMIDRHAN